MGDKYLQLEAGRSASRIGIGDSEPRGSEEKFGNFGLGSQVPSTVNEVTAGQELATGEQMLVEMMHSNTEGVRSVEEDKDHD